MEILNQSGGSDEAFAPTAVDIDLLALDLTRCVRCVGTLEHIEQAIDIVAPVLAAMNADVKVKKILVESEAQARAYGFVTSPTVRINGSDIAFDTLESECESCSDLCGCDEGTTCRVWNYRGEEHTKAPVGLIVESILGEIFGERRGPIDEAQATGELTPNLQRFFAGRPAAQGEAAACCSSTEQETCCDPAQKAECCDDSRPGTCGCR